MFYIRSGTAVLPYALRINPTFQITLVFLRLLSIVLDSIGNFLGLTGYFYDLAWVSGK